MAKIFNFFVRKQSQKKEVSIENARYWIPREINEHCENLLTLGKKYKIHYNEMLDEFYMYDDQNNNTVLFLVVAGEFI